MHFDSCRMPGPQRFDLWRDVLTRKLLRVAIDPLGDAPFAADAKLRAQHGLIVGLGAIGPTISRRTREIVAADNDDLTLMVNLQGPFIVDLGDGEITLAGGDAILVSCAEVGHYLQPSPGRMLCVRLPRAALSALVPEPEDRVGRKIPGPSDALRLLLTYADALWKNDLVTPSTHFSRLVVEHLTDLVALSVGADGEGAQMAGARGGQAAKLKAVKDCIEARIGPWPVSAEDVAAEVGVSPRYVRKLLEAQGRSFSDYLAERRLERARAMLTSARATRRSVSDIAYDVGFGDLSYFNRSFRRRFGRTPSEVRREGA